MTVGDGGGGGGNEKESRNTHIPTQFLSLTLPGFSYYLSQHLPATEVERKGALGGGMKDVDIENTNEQLQRKNSEFSTSIPRI